MPRSEFLERLSQHTTVGAALLSNVGSYQGSRNYWFKPEFAVQATEWRSTAGSLISHISPAGSYPRTQLESILSHQDMRANGAAVHIVEKLYALLKTVAQDIEEGRLDSWEYNITAHGFDEFLKYAEHFHGGGKKMESAVIACAVLEDTIKTIAKKSSVDGNGSLDVVIQRLTDAGVFTTVKRSRVQGYASLRNKAFHAEWDNFDLRDVGRLIEGVRELLDDFLAQA